MRPPVLRLHSDELIVDNFAGGGGASLGIEWALGRSPDIAVNHDPEAIAMHKANHPNTRHYCTSVWDVDPKEVCGGRPVGLAWFSPDCTFHSKARGAKPFRDRDTARRRRGLAWVVIRWAKAVRPRVIALENVEEFADWGPLDEDGRPDPFRRGFTYRRWKAELVNLGYNVEERELRACDYGAPTTRNRLFVLARCDGKPNAWPEQTHAAPTERLLGLQPFRTAADCIDWSLPCPSIFMSAEDGRQLGIRRPLSDNTLRRIARGVRKYVLESPSPFIVPVSHTGVRRAGPTTVDARVHSIDGPMPTITGASRGNHALVSPSLIQTSWGERKGQAPRILDIHAPVGTIMAGGIKHSVVAAFLAKHYGGSHPNGKPKCPGATDLRRPIDTVTAQDHHAIVASHIVKLRGGLRDRQDSSAAVEEPLPTLTAGGTHLGEVRAFLLKYYGTDQDPRLEDPLHTLTTKHRFGLVTVHGEEYQIVDIGMRMLTPRELYRAQGFSDEYEIAPEVDGKPLSKTAQIRMCGNSVCPPAARAIVAANFDTAGVALRIGKRR